MNPLNRRSFLRMGALGLAGGVWSPRPFAGRAFGAPASPWIGAPPTGKLLVIFLRGGNDALNTLPPVGDDADPLYPGQRGDIAIAASEAIQLETDLVCMLHPAMQPIMPIYNQGQFAFVNRVGFKNSSQSHFDAQIQWETAEVSVQGDEGFLARYLNGIADSTNPLPGASFYTSPQLILSTDSRAFPQIADLPEYLLDNQDILGMAPDAAFPNGKGLLGAYHAAADSAVRRDGLILLESMGLIQNGLPADYPAGVAAAYPDTPLGAHARDAAWVLTNTDCHVAVVSDGGWDTHADQGGATGGRHYDKLDNLANTLKAIYDDTQNSVWSDLAVLTISEFGRTKANDSGGTDHGKAGAAFLMGGGIRGGAYNCDRDSYYNIQVGSPTSPTNNLFTSPLDPNDGVMDHRTDFRTLYANVLSDHLGMSAQQLDAIIPGWSTVSQGLDPAYPYEFASLDLIV